MNQETRGEEKALCSAAAAEDCWRRDQALCCSSTFSSTEVRVSGLLPATAAVEGGSSDAGFEIVSGVGVGWRLGASDKGEGWGC